MSSRMFFTSIPRYLNYFIVSKDILKRLSVTWNCKCCNYTGSLFGPTRIVGHFTDPFAWRWVALPSPQFEFTVSCVPRRLNRCIAAVLVFSRYNTVGRWTAVIQCVAFNSRFLPLHPYLKNILEIFFCSLLRLTSIERYSLEIELKTLHRECSVFRSSSSWVQILQTRRPLSPVSNFCTKTTHRMVCDAKKCCQVVGNTVVNLLSQKENESNISNCTHSPPHTNFDVM